MPVKVEPHTSFDDAFRQSPELVWSVATSLLAGQSLEYQLTLLNDLALAAAAAHQDDQLLVILQMLRKLNVESARARFKTRTDFADSWRRDRAAEQEAASVYRQYLAKLYWQLPDSQQERTYIRDQDGSRYDDGSVKAQSLLASKHVIFRELITEWSYQPTESSVHAFRRVIAMGWPLSAQFSTKFDGEDDIEVASRGRFVGKDEQKQCLATIRTHLEIGSFLSCQDEERGRRTADSVFGPWLAQKRIPEDLEKVLFIARAKMGAAALARRDIRFAGVLNGLPESGIALMQGIGDQMRSWLADAALVVDAVVAAQRARYPHWRGTSVPHAVTCTSLNGISIEFTRCQDMDDQARTFSDSSIAMATAKKSGWFRGCAVTLTVRRNEDESAVLTNTWHF